MTVATRVRRRRTPLVFASAAALRAAERHMPRRTVENEVGIAMRDGRATYRAGKLWVPLDGGLVAMVAPSASRLTGRKAWLIVDVRPVDR